MRRPATKLAPAAKSGLLLLAAALLGFILANSPTQTALGQFAEFHLAIPIPGLHLDLSVAEWATDGLLAIFFFAIGLELKKEFVTGTLRDPKIAAAPIIAAVGGMVMPAVLFLGIIALFRVPGATVGWAVPTATDIAFALAVLSIFGGRNKRQTIFLLTLASADDLLAIIIIAVFFTAGLNLIALASALIPVVLFALVVRSRFAKWWILVPLAVVTWALVHESGIHATIAGVVLGLLVPARPRQGESAARAETYSNLIDPISNRIALPIFAFFAAAVPISGNGSEPVGSLLAPLAIAVLIALVVGKFVGVVGSSLLISALTRGRISSGLKLRDLVPVGFLAGIGFTVSLLIATLSFGDTAFAADAKIGIMFGSILSAVLAAVYLRIGAGRIRKSGKTKH